MFHITYKCLTIIMNIIITTTNAHEHVGYHGREIYRMSPLSEIFLVLIWRMKLVDYIKLQTRHNFLLILVCGCVRISDQVPVPLYLCGLSLPYWFFFLPPRGHRVEWSHFLPLHACINASIRQFTYCEIQAKCVPFEGTQTHFKKIIVFGWIEIKWKRQIIIMHRNDRICDKLDVNRSIMPFN